MKFKSKTLLIDKNENYKIRPCLHNYARMTILELMYCKIFLWKSPQRKLIYSLKDIVKCLKSVFLLVLDIISIPFLPILLYIKSIKEIKNAKYEVWKDKCYDCKYWKSSPRTGQDMTVTVGECGVCKLIDGMPTKFVESFKMED